MIRVYFVFEDALDDTGVNLSYVDVPTQEPSRALARVMNAAGSGELWQKLYPDETDQHNQYCLLETKMTYLDISSLPEEYNATTLLPL